MKKEKKNELERFVKTMELIAYHEKLWQPHWDKKKKEKKRNK